jgi:predicted metal-binding membrane protein
MMSSMMTFYNPAALSLFVIIWTAGMAAMMFPAIVPMILVYNRLIDTIKSKGIILQVQTLSLKSNNFNLESLFLIPTLA